MGDAEIIPIGTRGRPGRGTGKQPSSAARDLAGGKGPVARPATRRTPGTGEAGEPVEETVAPDAGPPSQDTAQAATHATSGESRAELLAPRAGFRL